MRVVILEDHALLREGMVALLQENGIEVVAQAQDGPGLQADRRRSIARIWRSATCGCRRPSPTRGSGPRSRPGPSPPGARDPRPLPVRRARVLGRAAADRAQGGVGYLLKERVSEVATFIEAVRRVAAGGTALDREVVSSLVGGQPPEASSADAARPLQSADPRASARRSS